MSLSSVAGILDGYGGWHTVVAPRKSLRHPPPQNKRVDGSAGAGQTARIGEQRSAEVVAGLHRGHGVSCRDRPPPQRSGAAARARVRRHMVSLKRARKLMPSKHPIHHQMDSGCPGSLRRPHPALPLCRLRQ